MWSSIKNLQITNFIMKNKQKGSTTLWVSLAILVVLMVTIFIVGAKNTNNQVSQIQTEVNTSENTSTPVNTSLYSYVLPSGWSIVPVGDAEDIQQAINKSTGDNFSIITNTLPPSLAKAASIAEIISQADIGKVALSNFTDATVNNVSTGTLNGKVAYITKLSRTETSPAGSQAQSIVQYSAISTGTTYSLIFMTATSRQDKAQPDFQSIIDSFKFK